MANYYDLNEREMWEILEDEGIVSEETLQVITDINGYSEETLLDVLFVVTGYRNFAQYFGEFGEFDEDEDEDEDNEDEDEDEEA